ncbi:MAG: hypothetical protein HC806_08125 [Anaerolineae bacterium]|nr:hypothetical protein [Anaerolineae bacterium]
MGIPRSSRRGISASTFGGEGGNVHVEAEVDGGEGIGEGVPVGDGLFEDSSPHPSPLPSGERELWHEIHHRRRAAKGCGFMAGVVIVRGHCAEHRQGEVAVWV